MGRIAAYPPMGCVLWVDAAGEGFCTGVLFPTGVLRWRRETRRALECLVDAAGEMLESEGVDLSHVDAFLLCEGPGSAMGLRVCKMWLDVLQHLRPRREVFSYNRLEQAAWEMGMGDGRLFFQKTKKLTALVELRSGIPSQPRWLEGFVPGAGDVDASYFLPDPPAPAAFLGAVMGNRAPGGTFTPLIPPSIFREVAFSLESAPA